MTKIPSARTLLAKVAAAGTAAALVLASSVGAATTVWQRDLGDAGVSAFYRWQQPLPDGPGRMLRQEPFDAKLTPPHAALARRILYSSWDGRFDQAIRADSGMVFLPIGTAPKGGWPLLVWNHGTMGLADTCAPSWSGPIGRDKAYIDAWLAAGFAVVAPDYQGLGTAGVHPYGAWDAESYPVLDAARAALAAYPEQIGNRIVLAGQSQGSGVALSADYAAPSYAAELRILGTIATGLVWSVHSDAPDPVAMMPDSPRINIMRMMAGSTKPGSPPIEQILSDKGMILARDSATKCSRDLHVVARQEQITPANAYRIAPEAVAAMLMPFDMPPARLHGPLFIGTGLSDELIAPPRQYRAVKAMCGYGSKVQWHPYPGITHSGTSIYALRDAIPFAKALLAGKGVASNCGALPPPAATLQKPRSDVPFND